MSDSSFLTLKNMGADNGSGAFGFGSFGTSGFEGEIETIEGLYDLAVLDADEDDDSIAAINGGIASCGSGGRQCAAKNIVNIVEPNQDSLGFVQQA